MTKSNLAESPATAYTYTYIHSVRGNQVDIIGVHHTDKPAVYEAVLNVMEARIAGGAVVHYEGLRESCRSEYGVTPPAVARRAGRIMGAIELLAQHSLDTHPEFVRQWEVLGPADTWKNYDVTELDLASRIGGFAAYAYALGNEAVRQPFFRPLYGIMAGSWQGKPIRKALARVLHLNIGKALLDDRNDVALDAHDRLQEEHPGASLVMLWGLSHAEGLGRGLRARNYESVGRTAIRAAS
ncbi:MAG TPA: hypothetical protein VLI54_07185 [Bacillota bacterium]|nr:hypothetical protein [Bacillota bacterium]